MSAPRIALLAPSLPLLDWAARQLVDQQRAALPDLSGITVLVPGTPLIAPLRAALLRHAGGALLGPRILTPAALAEEGVLTPALPALDCQLRLAQALESHRALFGGHDALALAADLHALFEALSAQIPELATDPECFVSRFARGYGAALAPLSDEARLVHTLWNAWLTETGGRHPAAARARNFAAALAALRGPLTLIGFDDMEPALAAALRPLLARTDVQLWLQGAAFGRAAEAPRAVCAQLRIEPQRVAGATDSLGRLFDDEAPLAERLRGLVLPPALAVQPARDAEHEARLAELAIRQWLLSGTRDIAIVSQDRRYARRLRALLERAGVPLRDEAGWALSTSSAAAALQHWLDCVEQDFPFRPLLALLKSVFAGAAPDAVDALESALYLRGVTGGAARLSALDENSAALLRPFVAAASHFVLHGGPRPAQQWSEALLHSARALPLWDHWALDRAGAQLLELLEDLHGSLSRSALRLSWPGFRALLRRLLEQASFVPEAGVGPVRLLTLEQSTALRCEALIIAGAAAGAFPGGTPAVSLFNQSVRAELGLPDWRSQQAVALARFRGLLQAAPAVLITYAPQNEGEDALPCPWVELLQAAGVGGAAALAARAGSAAVEVAPGEPLTLAPIPAPRPPAAAAQLPESLSASAHQALIDCPYRFHAGSSLGLRAPEEPDRPYSRQDFGERVHAILSRFTAPAAGHERGVLEQRLREAARTEFAGDLRARALAGAWLAEFESLVPDIAGWLIARGRDWPQAQAEQTLSAVLDGGLRLHGRADRLEHGALGTSSVVDYKTGAAPQNADIESGEQVQATHYALLAPQCRRVEYLQLRRDDFRSTVIEGAALDDARDGVRQRVVEVLAALQAGAGQPAHGDAETCARCDYAGLCRLGARAES
jgi:ATP-dependent helicase/nuclease subunit B